MERVTVAAAHRWPCVQGFLECSARRASAMPDQLVFRIQTIDRIAHRGYDPAVRDVGLDAPLSLGLEEVVRANLGDPAPASRVTKMARVPVDALVVEGAEELRLF